MTLLSVRNSSCQERPWTHSVSKQHS